MSTLQNSKSRKRRANFDELHAAHVDKAPPDIARWVEDSAKAAASRVLHAHSSRSRRKVLGETSHNQRIPTTKRMEDKAKNSASAGRGRELRPRPRRLAELPHRSTATIRNESASAPPDDAEASSTSNAQFDFEHIKFPPASTQSRTTQSPPRSTSPSKRSSSPRKRTIVKREELMLFSPRVDVLQMRAAAELQVPIPSGLDALWQRCGQRIDGDLTERPLILSSGESAMVEGTLHRAVLRTNKLKTKTTPESHWITAVVAPILLMLEDIEALSSESEKGNKNVGVFDVSTIEISPSDLLPQPSNTDAFNALDRKIDFAVGLELSNDALFALQMADPYLTSLNQTQSFVNWNPMFLNVEVKRTYQDKDPVIQLAVWVTAEFKKRKAEGWDISMPVLAVDISGDQWTLHVAAAKEVDTDPGFRVVLLGTQDLGRTRSKRDVRILFDNLCDICLWGRSEYLDWLQSQVLVDA